MQGQPNGSPVRNILKANSLKMEREQERQYLKEGSSLKPLRQVICSTENIQQTGEKLGGDWGTIRE